MNEVSVRHGLEVGGLLRQAVEQQTAGARGAAVEAEGEFVEVVVEVALLDAALKRAHEPALEQRGDVMDARHEFVRRIGRAADHRNAMTVAGGLEAVVAFPAISMEWRRARRFRG